eukprot:scaffold281268_cov26-Tisochrysis_lutea.AAC.1
MQQHLMQGKGVNRRGCAGCIRAVIACAQPAEVKQRHFQSRVASYLSKREGHGAKYCYVSWRDQ